MMILRGIRSGLTLALLLGGLAAGVTVNAAAWARNQSETAKILHKSILDKAYSHTDCRRAIGAVERRHRIPAQLLSAVALAESGRWMSGKGVITAWPWTVNAKGEGRFFTTREGAEAALHDLWRQGVRNIDVGCMQVNLKYHDNAFATLEEALDPDSNIEYAARLLRKLFSRHRSWSQAVAHYHSATKSLNVTYRKKVMRLWYQERRWAINERRRLVQAAYERRRADRPYRRRKIR